jgi:glucose/mannose-6-phosphate isomerase
MIVLSSGGAISENAKTDNLKYYSIPTGFQPRMTIGFGLSFLSMIIGELIGDDKRTELEDVIQGFKDNHEKQINTAGNITQFFMGSVKNKFVIVCDQAMSGPAVRFTQQVNENSKLEGFVNVLPESNHNVIESYTDRMPTNFIFLYTNKNERVSARFDFLLGHLEMDNNRVVPVVIPEYTLYSIFDVIYRLDWVSVNLANETGANLMEVPIITDLKEYLAQIEIVEED